MKNFEDPIIIKGKNGREIEWEVGDGNKESKIDFIKAKLELLESGKEKGFFHGFIVTKEDIEGENREQLEKELEELINQED